MPMLLPDFDGFREDFDRSRKAAAIERAASIISKTIYDLTMLCGPGRELSIVRTKLQEAAMWARQAIETRLETSPFEQATPLTPEKK